MKQLNYLMAVALICLMSTAWACSSQQQPSLALPSISTNNSCREDCCSSLDARGPMNYIYYQNTGRFRGGLGAYAINTLGYSGQGKGYLNPDYQCVEEIGPLPATIYQVAFCKNMMHQTTSRPCSFYLKPLKPLETCGRDDFFIHGCQCCTGGDDTEPPAAGCSSGCIVINYRDRRKLRVGDTITVVNYEPKIEDQVPIAQQ